MDGKTVVITGSTSGIGQVAAEALASMECREIDQQLELVYLRRRLYKAIRDGRGPRKLGPDW